MPGDILAQDKKRNKKKHIIWRRVCTLLAAVVVFVTTYSLILPAVTEESVTFCALSEHCHTDTCYASEYNCGAHMHTEACTETYRELICILEEAEAHTHDQSCYGQGLTCALPEGQPHMHTDACMQTAQELVCVLPEDESHTHNATCYVQTQSVVCGLQETEGHLHSEACYQQTLLCALPQTEGHWHTETCYAERSKNVCGFADGHVHTDACRQQTLICTLQEHAHSLQCYSNPNADLESAQTWEKNLPEELSGIFADDLLAVAKSQLGYRESENNYTVTKDGVKKGYNRYGAWYGDHYGDWCAMYISFCLEYAEVEGVPYESGCQRWVERLGEKELYKTAADYAPKAGDIVFFDLDNDNTADHVGIVESLEDGIRTIEGNTSNQVAYREYAADDKTIMGYCDLPVNPDTMLQLSATASDGVKVTLRLSVPAEEAQQYTLHVDGSEADTQMRALLEKEGLPKEEASTYSITLYKDGEAVELTDEAQVMIEAPTGAYAVRRLANNALEMPKWTLDENKITVETDDLSTLALVPASYSCGMTEHTHSADCLDNMGVRVCLMEEHTHEATCAQRSMELAYDSETVPGAEENHAWHSASYVYYQVSPYTAYEDDGRTSAGVMASFVLIPQDADAKTWTPNAINWVGDGSFNYEVAYCCDYDTYSSDEGGIEYDRMPISQSRLTAAQQEKLTAIAQNCYPFLSTQEVIARMKEAGFTVSDGCTKSELMTAAQTIIWTVANEEKFIFGLDASGYSGYKPQLDPIARIKYYDDTVESDIQAAYDFLNQCVAEETIPSVTATQQIASIEEQPDGTYTITFEITLNRALAEGESGHVTVADELGNTIAADMPIGVTSFTMVMEGISAENMRFYFDYYVDQDPGPLFVYFYDDEKWQDMIGATAKPSELSWSAELGVKGSTFVQVNKTWVGATGTSAVEVQLLRDGELVDTVQLSASNNWSYTWTNLDVGTLERDYVYTVKETPVAGYWSSLAQNADGSFTITNTKVEETSISVEKQWVGEPEGDLPASVTVTLLANGEPYGASVTLSSENDWLHIWKGLPEVDADGNPISYVIEEAPMSGFVPSITQGAAIPTELSWMQQSGFVNGKDYVLSSASGALANTSGSTLAWTTVDLTDPDGVSDVALWTATSSGNGYVLTNKSTGNKLTLSSSGYFSYSFTASSSGSEITYTNSRLKSGSYYFNGISSGKGSASRYSGTSFTLYSLETTSLGSDNHYILTNTAVTTTADILLQKKDAETQAALEGAEFALYLADEAESLIPNTEVYGTLIAEKLTTDADGQLTLTGLEKTKTYYLIETKAPGGYNLLLAPVVFTVENDGQITILSGELALGGEVLTVCNKPGYTIPNTGGTGTYLYTVSGLVLLTAAGLLALLKRRKQHS